MNKITNHLATAIVIPATPRNPSRPAIIASTKKVRAHPSNPFICYQVINSNHHLYIEKINLPCITLCMFNLTKRA